MKSNSLWKIAMAAFVGACVLAAPAEAPSSVWVHPGSRGNVVTYNLFNCDGTYWENGTAPNLLSPVSTNIVVDLTATATEAKRRAEIAAGSTEKYYGPAIFKYAMDDNTNNGLYFDSIVGNPWTIWQGHWSGSYYPVMLRDASAFKGVFDTYDEQRSNCEQLYLYPGSGKTGTINRVTANGGWGVKVSTGSYGIVNEVIGAGTLNVNHTATIAGKSYTCPFPSATAGSVEIMNRPGPLTTIKIYDGAVTLHGHDPVEPTAPAGVPVLRLDASVADSLVVSGTDNLVSRWNDADGRTAYYASEATESLRPRLTTDSVSGRAVVDFGGISTMTAGDGTLLTDLYGRSGALLLNTYLQNVCEIAIVFRDHHYENVTGWQPQLVGTTLGEYNRDWYRADGTIFHTEAYGDGPVKFGPCLFNGQVTLPSERPNTMARLNVVSSGLSDGHVGQIGGIGCVNEDLTKPYVGGAVISEVILYTNVLTAAEREQTHRYLMRKWCSDEKQWDFERIDFKKGNAITVADGVVSVRELNLPSGTTALVKKGAGTLEIGSYPTTRREIDIEEGDVTFAQSHERNDDPQPAADPTLHFDATRYADDMTTYRASGKTWITEWASWPRKNALGYSYTMKRSALPSGYTCTNIPSLRLNYPKNGLAMVDLGAYRVYADGTKNITNDATQLGFYRNGAQEYYTSSYKRHREGFAVYVKTDAKATAVSSLGWEITKMASGANTRLANEGFSFNRLIAGYWTYEGAWCEPWSQEDSNDAAHVVGWRATGPEAMNSFFNDRSYGPDGGGLLGEVIYYDRTLSPQERRDTELYLLRKWKDPAAVHPRDALLPSKLPHIRYLDGRNEVQVHVETGTVTQRVSRIVEVVEKTGAGSALVVADAETIRELRVDEGRLSVSDMTPAYADFHVDAADLPSMTYTVDSSGVTNVTKWGEATALTSWKSKTPATPKLIHADLNDLGFTMPLMDFGLQFTNETTSSELISSASSMTWPSLGPLQEFYVVFQDKYATVATGNHPQLIGTTTDGWTVNPLCSYPFHRQINDRALIKDWSSVSIANGYFSMDGVRMACTTPLTDTNLHAYAIVSTVPITNVFAFARRSTYRIGGAAIGECLAFATSNSVARRKSIEAYLCKKWLGKTIEAPSIAFDFDSIDVADGATLVLEADGEYGVRSLTGEGTVAFGGTGGTLTGLTTLSTTFTDAETCTQITVDGAVKLPASGTVTVAADEGFLVKAGWYPILTTTGLTLAGNLANWHVTNPDGRIKHVLALEKQGDVLGVHVGSTGMFIIFK